MRVVVFTGNPGLRVSPWWRSLLRAPGIGSILLVRQATVRDARQVLRRFRRNIARHGLIWIPYRTAVLAWSILRLFVRVRRVPDTDPRVEEYVVGDIHSDDVVQRLQAFKPDLGVSLGAPILQPSLFLLPRLGTLNLHLGKVPEFRGAPPAFWELMAGSKTIGATIHWIDEGVDTGPVVAADEVPIYDNDSLADVRARAAELGSRLLVKALGELASGRIVSVPQSDSGTVYRLPTLRQRAVLAWRMWRRRTKARLALRRVAKALAILGALYFYRPIRDVTRTLRRRHPVRVFSFHRVTTLCRDGMTVSPREFAEQVSYIARSHHVVSLEQGLSHIRSGSRLSRPVAVLTFDDGYRSVFEAARPILSRIGLAGTCFVSTDLVGTDRRFAHDSDNPVRDFLEVMNWDELRTLRAEGWSLGSHSASHARLSQCQGATLEREIAEPRRALREHLGVEAATLAYPFGSPTDITPQSLAAAGAAGHIAVFANFDGEIRTGTDSLLLGRFDIGGIHDRLAWRTTVHGIDPGRWRHHWPA